MIEEVKIRLFIFGWHDGDKQQILLVFLGCFQEGSGILPQVFTIAAGNQVIDFRFKRNDDHIIGGWVCCDSSEHPYTIVQDFLNGNNNFLRINRQRLKIVLGECGNVLRHGIVIQAH